MDLASDLEVEKKGRSQDRKVGKIEKKKEMGEERERERGCRGDYSKKTFPRPVPPLLNFRSSNFAKGKA